MDIIQVMEVINEVTATYEKRRIDELMSTAKGSSRIADNQIPGVLAKAQAAREIKTQLYNALGLGD